MKTPSTHSYLNTVVLRVNYLIHLLSVSQTHSFRRDSSKSSSILYFLLELCGHQAVTSQTFDLISPLWRKKRGFHRGQFKICFHLWNVYSLWLCLPNTKVFQSTDFLRIVYSLFFNWGSLDGFVRVRCLAASYYNIPLSLHHCHNQLLVWRFFLYSFGAQNLSFVSVYVSQCCVLQPNTKLIVL